MWPDPVLIRHLLLPRHHINSTITICISIILLENLFSLSFGTYVYLFNLPGWNFRDVLLTVVMFEKNRNCICCVYLLNVHVLFNVGGLQEEKMFNFKELPLHSLNEGFSHQSITIGYL